MNDGDLLYMNSMRCKNAEAGGREVEGRRKELGGGSWGVLGTDGVKEPLMASWREGGSAAKDEGAGGCPRPMWG